MIPKARMKNRGIIWHSPGSGRKTSLEAARCRAVEWGDGERKSGEDGGARKDEFLQQFIMRNEPEFPMGYKS
jgi:hypothetical protein